MEVKKIKGLVSKIEVLKKIGKTGKSYNIYRVHIANDPQSRVFSSMFHLPHYIVEGEVCKFSYIVKNTQGKNGQWYKNYNIVEESSTQNTANIPTVNSDELPYSDDNTFGNTDSTSNSPTIIKSNDIVKLLTEIRDLLKTNGEKLSTGNKELSTPLKSNGGSTTGETNLVPDEELPFVDNDNSKNIEEDLEIVF